MIPNNQGHKAFPQFYDPALMNKPAILREPAFEIPAEESNRMTQLARELTAALEVNQGKRLPNADELYMLRRALDRIL